jgi:shikimate 5-dehydrogenase
VGPLSGKRIAVVGAGGVAKSAVAGLTAAGALVTVYNRTAARATELAASVSASGHPVKSGDLADLATAPWTPASTARPWA